MEHIIITPIDEEFVKITPEEGYRLYNIQLNRYVSEAVCRRDHIDDYVAKNIVVVKK